jgi:membrane protease YdiL (CAAX protease family)
VSNPLQEMDVRTLRINLYVTQAIVFALAAAGSLFLHGWSGTLRLFSPPGWREILYATIASFAIVISNILMERFLPKRLQDDGEINRRIFLGLSFLPTLMLCAAVGVSEEWLFRGVIQSYLGNFGTSLLFTLIHFRYLRKPLLVLSVFATSFVLGGLFEGSHRLFAPILAHTMIDFLLARYLQRVAMNERRP